MKKFDLKKHAILEVLSKYILENGIKIASLRNMAEAASTSDRMLLHYFKDKEEIMTLTLAFITEKFIEILEKTRVKKMSFKDLMPYLYGSIKTIELKPYIRLCLELISLSANKDEPYYSIARQIGDTFYEWIDKAIIIKDHNEREEILSMALVTVEGFVVLNALGFDCRIEKAMSRICRKI